MGLLKEEPLHGYEVKNRFEAMLGGTWEVNIGQIYTTLDRLVRDPASFAAIEREVHDQARRQADLYVAGLLAKASARPEMEHHVDQVVAAAAAFELSSSPPR